MSPPSMIFSLIWSSNGLILELNIAAQFRTCLFLLIVKCNPSSILNCQDLIRVPQGVHSILLKNHTNKLFESLKENEGAGFVVYSQLIFSYF